MGKVIELSSIGVVKIQDNEFKLVINKEYIPALMGLEGFSHINVLWWCSFFEDAEYRTTLTTKQPYKGVTGELGIFATRSPVRPNPLGLTSVKIVKIDFDGGEITLDYIDAEDGTPILDIKPYYPCSDRVKHAMTPEWSMNWPQWLEDTASFDWSTVFINAR